MSDYIVSVAGAELEAVLSGGDRPVLIDFWAPWCGPCKAMLPILEEVAETYAGEIVVANVNIEEDTGSAERFNARSIPLFVLFRNGAEAARTLGSMSKTRLCAFIDLHLEASA